MGEKRLGSPRRLTKTNISRTPDRAGIYVVKSAQGAIQYVGMSRKLKTRLEQHLAQKSIPNANTFQIRTCRSAKKAANLERNYIRRYRPKYNILKNK